MYFIKITEASCEKKDLEYLQSDPVNEIKSEINGIRKYIIELGMMIDKSDKDKIRKRLDEIDKKTRINRTEKKILLEELSKISIDLQYKRKRIGSAYDSDDYYGLRDLEYTHITHTQTHISQRKF